VSVCGKNKTIHPKTVGASFLRLNSLPRWLLGLIFLKNTSVIEVFFYG